MLKKHNTINRLNCVSQMFLMIGVTGNAGDRHMLDSLKTMGVFELSQSLKVCPKQIIQIK